MSSLKSPESHSLISCEECRRRKRKCSKDKPVCSMCLKNNSICMYRRPRKRGPPKGYMLGMRSTRFISGHQCNLKGVKPPLEAFLEEKVNFKESWIRPFTFSAPSIALPKIPLPLQTEMIRIFLKYFGCSAPIFHHKYLYHRISKRILPEFLLQTIFAIGSRFFLKAYRSEPNIPNEWVKIVSETDFAGAAMQLAQQQVFMEPNIYNAIALALLSLMLYYDGLESAASTCLILSAKIVQERGLALQDVDYDILGNSPTDDIEKEERRRLFWWLLILDRWAQQRTMITEESTACILPPGDDIKWQQLSFSLSCTEYRISYEDRRMWSFMIEIEFLHSDILSLLGSILDCNKLPTLFGKMRVSDGIPDAQSKLQQLRKALQSWDNRLPFEYRYIGSPTENTHTSAQLDIPKWMRISYLISKLHLYQIQTTLHWNAIDVDMVKECLETVAQFINIIQYLPEEELIDDPLAFSYNIFTCRVLLTIIEYATHTNISISTDRSSNLGYMDRLHIFCQVKQHIDSIYGLFLNSAPVWKCTIRDLSQLTHIKATVEHMYSLFESQPISISSLPLEEHSSTNSEGTMELIVSPSLDIYGGHETTNDVNELNCLSFVYES